MLILLWCLNLGISIFNAVGCGKNWNEAKHVGGMAYFMVWMVAVMAAVGFTWCYLLPTGFIASQIPMEAEDGTSYMLLGETELQAFYDLGYLAIIFPAIGSGLAITLSSWNYFWRRRTFGSGAITTYNTFAQAHNMYQAAQHVPQVWDRLSGFFGEDSSSDKKGQAMVVFLVVAVVFAGILTTWAIITSVARSTALSRNLKYEEL